MERGSRVNLMGVHRSVYVDCLDEGCPRKHWEEGLDEAGQVIYGRYHYADGPVEGKPGVVAGPDAQRVVLGPGPEETTFENPVIGVYHLEDDWSRVTVLMDNGQILHTEAENLEVL